MREYSIQINPSAINFRPKSTLEEILQNVNTIASTVIGSVPLFRKFGTDPTFLDDPTPITKVKYVAEITERVEEFEPRVIVMEVKYSDSDAIDGKLNPIIIIAVREEVEL